MRFLLALLLAAVPALADAILIGVKAGVPLTDVVETVGEIDGRPLDAQIQRFTIGPVLNIRLPLGLAIEFGAMYKQFDQRGTLVETGQAGETPAALQGLSYSQTGRSWEFPLVGQYHFPGVGIHPYLEAGLAFNRLSDVLHPFSDLSSPFSEPESSTENRRGFVAGGGLELTLPFMRVSPGLRWTHYGKVKAWLPSADGIDFLVGITF